MFFVTIGAIQKESLGFEIYICCVNTALSQIPCTCLPECFDKIRLVESRRPRSQLAFKNIYMDYHEWLILPANYPRQHDASDLFYTIVRKFDTIYRLRQQSIRGCPSFSKNAFTIYFLPPNHRTTMRLIFFHNNQMEPSRQEFVNNITKCFHSSFYIKFRNHSLFVDKTLGSTICQAISNWWVKAI